MASRESCDIVEATWKRLNLSKGARRAALSSFKMVLIFSALLLDMSYAIFSDFFAITHPVLWFVELSICVLLILHVMSNGLLLFKYLWVYFFGSSVSITEEQRLLMAIPLNDKGFQTPPKSSNQSQVFSTPLTFNNSHNYSANDVSPHRLSNSFSTSTSTANHSYHTRDKSNRISPYQSFVNTSLHGSFNASYSSLDRSLNLSNVSQSSTKGELNGSTLRARRSASLPVSPRNSSRKRIASIESLNNFIMEEEVKAQSNMQASPDNLTSNSMSFWSYGNNPLDFTHILRKFAYQLASRSSVSPAPNSSSDIGTSHGIEEVWGKFGVTEDDLYLWTERLRKWLSFTIITRLKAEIDGINSCLQRIGCEDTQIGDDELLKSMRKSFLASGKVRWASLPSIVGDNKFIQLCILRKESGNSWGIEVGISTLKQLALTRGNSVQGLNSVIPYLDLMANQEYIVHRINDLSTGSMSDFYWNKGGNYGKPWGEHLSTDAAVVVHLFCSYLDARLPVHPKYPDGKPFTSEHFIKTPEKPNLEQKDNILIYQSSINPPHFQIVFGSDVFNLSKGRNNMFQAVLLFLYLIKQREAGMLGRVNLGKSGLNILWIFD